MFVDSHCHLDFPDFAGDRAAVLDAMAAARVTHALCIAVNLPTGRRCTRWRPRMPNLYATVGVHPDYPDIAEPSVADLVALRGAAQGRRHRRDRARLLPPDRRPRLAARALPHPHPRRARGRPAAGDPHARSAAADTLAIMREERADEVGRRDALLHRDLGRRGRRRSTSASTSRSPASSPSRTRRDLNEVARRCRSTGC